jgi:hypothetical protein
MSTDRRESLRTEVELPLQWLSCEARAPTDQLCKLFGLPGFIRFHGRLAALASEFSRALHEVRDPATIGALEILDAKLNVFDEALHAETATPPEQSLELATRVSVSTLPSRSPRGSGLPCTWCCPRATMCRATPRSRIVTPLDRGIGLEQCCTISTPRPQND